MSFIDTRFPTDISYGSKGGPGYSTLVVVSDSGNEERVARWQNPKRQYDVRYGIKSREQMYAVIELYTSVQGALNGFRYKDWVDYNSSLYGHRVPEGPTDNTTPIDQVLGTGDGATTQFQLAKVYTFGSTTRTRNITKPVDGSISIAIDGTPSVAFGLDATTGIITFDSVPDDGAALTWGGEFDVPVRFGKGADALLQAEITDFGYGSLDPINLVEIPDGLFVNDDANVGGAVEIAISHNYTLSASYARAYAIEPQTTGLSVILPDPTTVPTGGPTFWLMNLGPDSITIKTFAGATLATLSSGNGVDILLTVDGSSSKSWTLI